MQPAGIGIRRRWIAYLALLALAGLLVIWRGLYAPAGVGIGWPWIAGLALLALAGLFVIWRGLYPRRQGTTPYCRQCGYNLTGKDRTAKDARCPECGSIVTADDAIVLGERTRRWRRVFAGLVIFLLGTTPLVLIGVGAARGVDWYRYKPTGLVLRDLESANNNLAGKAASEITRRFQANALSPERVAQVAEVSLNEQARPSIRAGVTRQLIDLLGVLYARGLLTADQVDRFFKNSYTGELRVRPLVIRGRPFPTNIVLAGRAPKSAIWVRAKYGDTRVNGQVAWLPELPPSGVDLSIATCSATRYLAATTVGRHQIALDLEIEIHTGYLPHIGDALRTIRRTLTAEVTVVEQEPADYIRLKSSPALDAMVRDAVRPRVLRTVATGNDDAPHALECRIEFDAQLPIGLAFDVRVEFGEESLDLGFISASAGRPTPTVGPPQRPHPWGLGFVWPLETELPCEAPGAATLVLQSSKEAAERTVDLFEIWDGELRFDNVPVEQLPELQSTASGVRTP